MNKKDVESIAFIIYTFPEEIQMDFFRLDKRIKGEVEAWKEFRKSENAGFMERAKAWEEIARENGAIIIWGNTISFQGDNNEENERRARKEFKNRFGDDWKGGNLIYEDEL